MLRSLNTAVSGLNEFQQDIDVIGNNIANVNTAGFKEARAHFEDTFSQVLGSDIQVGSGVSTAAVSNNFTQGAINNSGVGTDLAISGQGFFVVRNTGSNADSVTRAGDFHTDVNGYLVTNGGLRVQGYNDSSLGTIGDLLIDATGAPATAAPGATISSFNIDQFGKINVRLSDGTQFVRGQVLLQTFRNPGALIKEGENLYSPQVDAGGLTQAAAAQTNGLGLIQAGALEMSNVDLTGEMAGLITAQRAFQANARMITTSDEILQEVVNLKR